MKIAPSVLTADFTKLTDEMKSIDAAEYIHIDVMDGNFVPNISFGPAITKQIASLANKNKLDVHLMVLDPAKWINAFALNEVDYITVHYESNNFLEAVELIKEANKKVGITIKPATPVTKIIEYLNQVDLVLIMSVEPGFGGQKFMPEMLEKVRDLVKLRSENNWNYLIEIDGGMNDETLMLAKEAGVDIAVVGSHLFNQKNRNKFIKKWR